MDIGRELQQLRARLDRIERSARLSHAAIDDTAVEVRDSSGSLRGLIGVQSDGTTAVNIVNGTAPPAPSTPTVASALGGIAAGWDGTFAGSQPIPLDWSRVEVHASTDPGFTPSADTLQATIETPQGATAYLPATAPTYVRLLARNTSGTASDATTVVGPYSPRPVAGEIGIGEITATLIADGAITTPKLFANAVTAGKIQAGAVDATALAADAITGKTITGGTITGALIQTAASGQRITLNEAGANKVLVYNGSGTAIGELSVQGLLVKGTSGAVLWLDPNNAFPNLRLTNAAQSNSAVINVSTNSPGAADLGMNSGTFTSGTYTDMKWRMFLGNDFGVIERVRDSNPAVAYGGRLDLRNNQATLGYVNADDTSQNNSFIVVPGAAQLTKGRMEVYAPASSNTAVYAQVDSGHTGNLLRLYNSGDKFTVDKDGNLTAAGDLTLSAGHKVIAGAKQTPTYEPNFVGGSSAAARYAPLSYRITAEGNLHVAGHFRSTTARAAGAYTAFVLPSGYIPASLYAADAIHVSSTDVWRTAMRFNVDNNGSVGFATTSAISANDGFYVNLIVPMT